MILDIAEIKNNREEILSFLSSYNRPGTQEFSQWLQTTDFFVAPASTVFHLNVPGGLAKHSLNVGAVLYKQVQACGLTYTEEQCKFLGLLHDLCKVNFYVLKNKWVKNDETNKWMETPGYGVEDNYPLGHGEKSAIMASRYFKDLSIDELAAIRWHMGAHEISVLVPYSPTSPSYHDACKKIPLVTLICSADMIAANILEETEDLSKHELSTMKYLTSI